MNSAATRPGARGRATSSPTRPRSSPPRSWTCSSSCIQEPRASSGTAGPCSRSSTRQRNGSRSARPETVKLRGMSRLSGAGDSPAFVSSGGRGGRPLRDIAVVNAADAAAGYQNPRAGRAPRWRVRTGTRCRAGAALGTGPRSCPGSSNSTICTLCGQSLPEPDGDLF